MFECGGHLDLVPLNLHLLTPVQGYAHSSSISSLAEMRLCAHARVGPNPFRIACKKVEEPNKDKLGYYWWGLHNV